jgi:stress response protein YsnF
MLMASDGSPTDLARLNTSDGLRVADDVQVMPLHAEQVTVSKRVRKTQVRVARTTRTRDALIEEDLAHHQVLVERVAIGRVVDAVPEVRQEGDVTIIPVVEEVVVVERRLVLKEELHMRQVRTTERHVETVTLREQQAVVTRTEIED